MRRLDAAAGILTARRSRHWLNQRRGRPGWPVSAGSYLVTDPTAPVAVCTLADDPLVAETARLPGVAISGRLYTANLGIEKIITNVTANPAIRFLVLCGHDSSLFQPGQTLRALFAHGVDADRRILHAPGYLPTLRGISLERIERFRRQVELVEAIGQTDPTLLAPVTTALADRSPGVFHDDEGPAAVPADPLAAAFVELRPGGHTRQPLGYDPVGYFVITLNPTQHRIAVYHYHADNTPAHRIRARTAQAILQALLREQLVSQLSHASYLGAELAKAEAALALNLPYEQDRPLRAPRRRPA